MAHNSRSSRLTDEQKVDACKVLAIGCDRQTAADWVGCSRAELSAAMKLDPEFAARARRAEARCEVVHMRVIYKASKIDKQWRASLWWLECQAPERYAPRGPGVVGRKHLDVFVTALVEIIRAKIPDPEARGRLVEALRRRADELDDALDNRPSSRETSADWLKAALYDGDSTDSTGTDLAPFKTNGKGGESNGRL